MNQLPVPENSLRTFVTSYLIKLGLGLQNMVIRLDSILMGRSRR